MTPVRRARRVFVDQDGHRIPPAPSRLTGVEREANGPPQPRLLQFEDSKAPTPKTASVRATTLPAQVGAAQALRSLRHSTALRAAARPKPVRRRNVARKAASTRRRKPARRGATGARDARTRRTYARRAR